jgi:hypothetical protein
MVAKVAQVRFFSKHFGFHLSVFPPVLTHLRIIRPHYQGTQSHPAQSETSLSTFITVLQLNFVLFVNIVRVLLLKLRASVCDETRTYR